MESNNKIALWSGPRNVSTALMYFFAHRGDTQVLDEPLFGHFLKFTGVWRPSREEVLTTMETNIDVLLANFKKPRVKKNLFLKNMANHIEGVSITHFKMYKHFILIRHPRKVLASYTKHVQHPTEVDLCYGHQLKLARYFTKNKIPFKVIDSDALLKNQTMVLNQLCQFLEIPFSEDMLKWPQGAIPEDGVWAKYWYKSVHQSTGFSAYVDKEYTVEKHLEELLKSSELLYNQLKEYEQIQLT